MAIADSLLVPPSAGGDVLIDSTAGPIAAIAPRDSYQDAVLGFEIVGQGRGRQPHREHELADPALVSDFLAQCARISGDPRRRTSSGGRAAGPAGGAQGPGEADRLTVVDSGRPRKRRPPIASGTRFRYRTPTTGDLPGPPGMDEKRISSGSRSTCSTGRKATWPCDPPKMRRVKRCGRPISVSVTSTLRPRTDVPRPAQETWKLLLACACSCCWWSGISTIDGYISEGPTSGTEVADLARTESARCLIDVTEGSCG